MFSNLSWRTFTIGLFALAGVLTLGILLFYMLITPTLRRNALLEQERTAQTIMRDLESSMLITQQIGRSTAALISPLRTNVEQVETTLEHILRSAPSETVYGIGAWFEPNIFTPTSHLFGPYVHRSSTTNPSPILTYEWTTSEYNFYSQAWYQIGRTSNSEMIFTEPYFDTDLVYMSGVQPFTANNTFAGVITVDMVLPQLRNLIAQLNIDQSQVIYVLTQEGALFAHPDEQLLLEWAQNEGQAIQNILDIDQAMLEAFAQRGPSTRRHTLIDTTATSVTMPATNWQVFIITENSVLFDAQERIFAVIIFSLCGLWASTAGIFFLAKRYYHRINHAQHNLARSEQKFSQLFENSPYPILLFDAHNQFVALANSAALNFYDYATQELYTKRLNEISTATHQHQLARYTQHDGIFEDEHRTKAGTAMPVVVRSQEIDIDGRTYLQCYIVDQSEQKQAKAQVVAQQATIRSQEVALAQATIPIIPISESIITIPLIGNISQERSQQLLHTVAYGLEQLHAQVIILDVTGVALIDEAIAAMLMKAHGITKLMGAELILTGIRPEIAQSLVNLQIPFGELQTYSTLQQGIQRTLNHT